MFTAEEVHDLFRCFNDDDDRLMVSFIIPRNICFRSDEIDECLETAVADCHTSFSVLTQ